jgi:hypothetical protein
MRRCQRHMATRLAGVDVVVLRSRGPAGLRSRRRSLVAKLPPSSVRIALLSAFLVAYGQVPSWSSRSAGRIEAPAPVTLPEKPAALSVSTPGHGARDRRVAVDETVKTSALARVGESAGEPLFARPSCRARSYTFGEKTITVHQC